MGNAVVHFEINGPDGPALQSFYAELFGWHVQWVPEMNYGLVDTHGGQGINGGIGSSQDGAAYVTFYIEGPDPQGMLDAAERAGGTTVVPVTEIPGVVTFALFSDPAGNHVGVVKGGDGEAPAVSAGSGAPVSWFELLAGDANALAEFYASVFGWQTKDSSGPGFTYFEVDTGAGGGIGGGIGSAPDGNAACTIYAEVDDVQKYLEKAEALGGKIAMPSMEVMQGLTIGQIVDPQGNRFGLYRRDR